jgi:hypothetical protein
MSAKEWTFTSLINIWNSLNRFLDAHAVTQRFSDIRTNRQRLLNISTFPERFVDVCTDLEQFLKTQAVPQQFVNICTNLQRFFEHTYCSKKKFGHTYRSRAVFENSCKSAAICEHAYRCITIFFSSHAPFNSDLWNTRVVLQQFFKTRFRRLRLLNIYTFPLRFLNIRNDIQRFLNIGTGPQYQLEGTFEFIGYSLPCKMTRIDVISIYLYETK